MGYIFIDRESDGSQMRQQMRRSMRGGYRHDGMMPTMRGGDSYEYGYRIGYKHGWEGWVKKSDAYLILFIQNLNKKML